MPSKQPSNPPQPDITRTIEDILISNFGYEYDEVGNVYLRPMVALSPTQLDKAVQKLVTLVNEARVDELKLLLKDWDMAEREPGDQKVHEYKDFETIKDRIKELSQ
jgi:hypothetical protein